MNFIIGAAQFGLNYGITNEAGQVSSKELRKILSYAKNNNILSLDTAIEYGDSEIFLGKENISDWQVVTKLPRIPKNTKDVSKWINQQIKSSLSRLKIPKLYGLLLHTPVDLLSKNGKEIWETIQSKKDEGLVEKIGFSIYNPNELELLWDTFRPDIVQAPFNILDRRIKTSGWLQKLNKNGVEVQVRSIFLQGLLLMDPIERNKFFYKWHSIWSVLDSWLIDNNVSPIEASLGFVLSEKNINCIVVGVESKKHLNEIISISNNNYNFKLPEALSINDVNLIEPVNWNLT